MPTMETKNPSKILVVDDDPRLRDLEAALGLEKGRAATIGAYAVPIDAKP